jgi:hypothetical protein
MKFEREEIGHCAYFGRDRAIQTVSVKGEILKETKLGDFGRDFADEAVSN